MIEPREITTIPFVDADSGNEAVAIIRKVDDKTALCISINHGSDVEVLLDTTSVQQLIDALGIACSGSADGKE